MTAIARGTLLAKFQFITLGWCRVARRLESMPGARNNQSGPRRSGGAAEKPAEAGYSKPSARPATANQPSGWRI